VDIRTTLAERTADLLRHRILTLTPGYEPGDRLYPHRLAQDLGVSVTPIREALKLLAAEWLIEFSPRRGASVVRLSEAELDDLMAVQSGLEALAVRLGGGRLGPEDVDRLTACLDASEEAIARNDIATYRAKDAEFHRLLVAASHSPRLIGLYDVLLQQAQILAIQSPRYLGAMRESFEDHRALVAELALGEGSRAEEAIRAHWERSRERLLRKYDEFIRAARGGDVEPPAPPLREVDR
jgi:DNA-binding GntR family transcriptional regulator